MKTIYHLVASTTHGVQEVDALTAQEMCGELTPFRDFEEALPILGEDEIIRTAVDPDELQELQESYSVELMKA